MLKLPHIRNSIRATCGSCRATFSISRLEAADRLDAIQDAGADAGFWRGGGVLHELLMKGRGAREARENFCGAHFNLSTDFIGH